MSTDPAALTDEELAEIEETWEDADRPIPGVRRLIAALRARSAEVARLQAEVDDWRERWEAEGMEP